MTPLLLALAALALTDDPAAAEPAWLRVRGGLPVLRAALTTEYPVRVAFLGGSITEGDGYRPRVQAKLRAKYPGVTWEFHNAGVASTGSTTGVFRYRADAVTAGGAWREGATLVVAEAAVNDDQDERLPAADAGWGMEGLARMIPSAPPPQEDLLFVHFPNPPIVAALRAGTVPASVAAHERVAQHYHIPSVNVAAEVVRQIDAGMLTWEQYGGTHPGPVGHELAADMIVEAISRCLLRATSPPGIIRRWPRAKAPLRPDAIDAAMLRRPLPLDAAILRRHGRDGPLRLGGAVTAEDDWTMGVPEWSKLPGACRSRFKSEVLLHTTTPGATLTVARPPSDEPFTTLGLYVLAGPDAGAVEVSVPGEPPKTVQLYHEPHSKNLHYPRTVLLYRDSKPPAGPVMVKAVKGERGGTAVRVVGVGLGFITRDRAGAAEADAAEAGAP